MLLAWATFGDFHIFVLNMEVGHFLFHTQLCWFSLEFPAFSWKYLLVSMPHWDQSQSTQICHRFSKVKYRMFHNFFGTGFWFKLDRSYPLSYQTSIIYIFCFHFLVSIPVHNFLLFYWILFFSSFLYLFFLFLSNFGGGHFLFHTQFVDFHWNSLLFPGNIYWSVCRIGTSHNLLKFVTAFQR